MSSKFTISKEDTVNGLKTGVENPDIPEEFDIPSCGIEDVDRAVFKLFNEDIPLFFEKDGDLHRIPCIFASGERAFILRKQQPLRDRQGALILPLVSILRNGIEQDVENRAISQGDGEIIIKRQLAPEDIEYKRLLEKQGTKNYTLEVNPNSIYEFITIPTPRYFKSSFEITFWSTYLQTMNHMLEAFMSSYNIDMAKSFRIESPKGYWFVAHVESSLSDGGNADSYLDEERLIKTTISLSVTGYIINPKFPGAPKMLRRYISAPKVDFNTSTLQGTNYNVTIPSGDEKDYAFDNVLSDRDPLPGSGIGNKNIAAVQADVHIGGQTIDADRQNTRALTKVINPFSNNNETVKVKNLPKGETVYRNIKN